MIQKRIFDLILSIPGLILLAPFFLVFAILIKIDSPGAVFFRQKRVGLKGSEFEIYKFRTMIDNAEQRGLKISVGGDPRITILGRYLRKFKLDELPQLINVVKGEMSLVGPRPEVPEYIKEYPLAVKNKILSMLPGITDFAAIQFRDENEMLKDTDDPHRKYVEEILPIKIDYYLKYIESRSLWIDFVIIIKTITILLKRW